MIVALLLIAFTPPAGSTKQIPAAKVNTADSKIKIEEAKKNSIMRRFISYTNIESFH